MKSKVRKPFIALTSAALGATLVLSPGTISVLAAETQTTVSANPTIKLSFPDVPENHWAKGHVAKLAAAKVITGYQDGSFQPNKAVSQQEAIVMVVRIMGLEDEVQTAVDAVTGLGEDRFFSKYVKIAADYRFINLLDETIAAQQGTEPWGQRPATREWIAKLIVNALGETPNTAAALQFSDAAQISEKMAGYVSKSAELGLVNGIVENGKTFFKPAEAVTRAQLVTILSRADQYIEDDDSLYFSGYIMSRSASSLQLRAADGTVKDFTLSSESLVYNENGERLSLNSLTERTGVRVLFNGNQAYYIEVSDDVLQLETIEGELAALDIENMTLVLRLANGTVQPFNLASNAAVTNAQGSGLSLSQLTEGSEIKLQRLEGTEEVTKLMVTELAYNAEGMATVISANIAERTITFTDASGKIVTYPLTANAVLSIKDQPITSLSGIQEGDTFEYVIRDSKVTELNVTVPKYVTVTGSYQGTAGKTITVLKDQKTPAAYLLSDNVKVIIAGMENTKLTDLQTGDIIQLRMSGSSEVVDQITVSNRNVENLRSVQIDNLDKDYLTVRDENGKPRLFLITDRTQFRFDGAEMPREWFDSYLAEGRKVNLSVSSDQLLRLDVVTKLNGTVTALNTTGRTITIRTTENEEMTIPYALYISVELPRTTSASIADVAVGDRVQLTFSIDNGSATGIKVERSYVYTLSSIGTDKRTLSAKDYKGVNVSVSTDTNTKVTNAQGKSITVSELPIGKPIIVNYLGRNVESVQEASVVRAVVSRLDIIGQKLSVKDFNGNEREIDLSKGITVQANGTVTESIAALKLNDRLEVVTDAQGRSYVTAASVEIRKFSSYSAADQSMNLKISKVGDQRAFKLDENVYVHTAGGELLTMSRLKEDDEVTFYTVNGKVIEIIR